MSQNRDPASLTIAAAATTSNSFQTQATRGSFQLPSTFTGVSCVVHGSVDGTANSFTPVVLQGNETSVVAAGKTYAFPVLAFNFKYLRLVVDAQAAEATVLLFTRDT